MAEPDHLISHSNDLLFNTIAEDISSKGYSINFNALPPHLSESLWLHLQNMNKTKFSPAGIGRKNYKTLNKFIRRDVISWITGSSVAGSAWLAWANELQMYLNRK